MNRGKSLATSEDEENWRTLMDGAWIDMFLHKYARQRIIDTEAIEPEERREDRLKVAKLSETSIQKIIVAINSLAVIRE